MTNAADPTPSSQPPVGTLSRLRVLMFTDIVDSTALHGEIGPDRYRPLVEQFDAFTRRALSIAPSGQILQDTGDGHFVAFDNVGDAVRAALLFQYFMARHAWPVKFAARVGLHLGQVEEFASQATQGTRHMAMAANFAARIMSLAQGGQILLTRPVFDEARLIVRAHPAAGGDGALIRETASDFGAGAGSPVAPVIEWKAHGLYLFKGADEPTEVCEVGAVGVAPLTAPPDSEKVKRHLRPGDEQTLGWRPAAGLDLPANPNWRLAQKLGEGGFGEVWLAEQVKSHAQRVFKFCFDADRLRSLKREVVLFRLLKEALGDRRDIARVIDWQFDAPPYSLELDYAPEGNLTDWAARHGGIGAAMPLADRVAFVARVAEALAAAHSVGILHKDIKPSNILMVRDGEGTYYPRLTDFGIGILTDRDRLKAFNITAVDLTASNLTANDSSRTGTRMYAPPESQTDKPHTVQGDVYALGVLLYQMVVGDLERPFAAGWERGVGDPLLRADIGACVEGDPALRLTSAEELARRLNALEARRQEEADRARSEAEANAAAARAEASARLAARRKRVIRALGSTVAVLAVLLAVIAALWLEVDKQRRAARASEANARAQAMAAEQARAAEQQQRQVAERRFEDVQALSNTMLFDVHGAIENLAGSTPARRTLVTTALDYLERLAKDAGPGDRRLRRSIAAGYTKVGDVLTTMGDAAAALAAHERAAAIDRALADADAGDAGARRDLAIALSRVGAAHATAGDYQRALASFDEALAIRRPLVAAGPGARRDVSAGLLEIGDAKLRLGDAKGAQGAYDEAVGLFRAFAAAAPADPQARRDLSVCLNKVGDARLIGGDAKAALAAYDESLAAARKLAEAAPEDARARRDVSIGLIKAGDTHAALGDAKAALAAHEESVAIARALSAADPKSARARRDLTVSLNRLSGTRMALGDVTGARAALEEVLAVSRKAADADPGGAGAAYDLSSNLDRLGDVRAVAGDLNGAMAAFEESLGIRQKLVAADADNLQARRGVWWSQFKVADAARTMAKAPGAAAGERVANARRAVEMLTLAVAGVEAMAKADLLPPADKGAPALLQGELRAAREELASGDKGK